MTPLYAKFNSLTTFQRWRLDAAAKITASMVTAGALERYQLDGLSTAAFELVDQLLEEATK